jgi:HEPN domain-containing protein
MSESPKRKLLRQWLVLANADLANALNTFRTEADPTNTTICFHVQQSVEKFIKSVLVFNGVSFPKTHDIAELMSLSRPHLNFSRIILNPDLISQYAVSTRYPGAWSEITREEVEAALDVAYKVQRRIDRYFQQKKVRL